MTDYERAMLRLRAFEALSGVALVSEDRQHSAMPTTAQRQAMADDLYLWAMGPGIRPTEAAPPTYIRGWREIGPRPLSSARYGQYPWDSRPVWVGREGVPGAASLAWWNGHRWCRAPGPGESLNPEPSLEFEPTIYIELVPPPGQSMSGKISDAAPPR